MDKLSSFLPEDTRMLPLHDDNPTRIKPYITIAIIILCVVVFLYQQTLSERGEFAFVLGHGAIPAVLFGHASLPEALPHLPSLLTVISSMFLHGGWMHIIGNMLYLWVFGNNVEDSMGHRRFIAFYLICGIAAALSHALADPLSKVPMIGASGAISGILGAYVLLYPRARVLVVFWFFIFFKTFRIRAQWLLGFWFLWQVFSLRSGPASGGVAVMAHVGGFLCGMALIPFFKYAYIPLFRARSGPWG